MNWNIIKSTEEEIELIDNTLGDYNKTQVQYIPQIAVNASLDMN